MSSKGRGRPGSKKRKTLPKTNKDVLVAEGAKNALFLKGTKTSQVLQGMMSNLAMLKKPAAKSLSGRNAKLPFEDESSVEFLCEKNACGLFAFGSHSKKRPHNLILGRTFDNQLLDMFEFGVENFVSMESFKGAKGVPGNKPMFMFQGDLFEQNDDCKQIRNLFLDFFRGQEVTQVSLAGLSHVCVCTAVEAEKILMRWYTVAYRKSGTNLPRVELLPMGPFCDLVVRRKKTASEDLMKLALRRPKEAQAKRVKNVAHDSLGEKIGRIHMGKQDFDQIQTRKTKALKATVSGQGGEEDVEQEEEEEEEEAEEEEEEEEEEGDAEA